MLPSMTGPYLRIHNITNQPTPVKYLQKTKIPRVAFHRGFKKEKTITENEEVKPKGVFVRY